MTGCIAVNCTNRSEKGFRLFKFPANAERRTIWIQNMRRDSNWEPTNTSCLCEKHFEESQFETRREDGWKKLKPNAIPTLFSDMPNVPPRINKLSRRVYKNPNEKMDHSNLRSTRLTALTEKNFGSPKEVTKLSFKVQSLQSQLQCDNILLSEDQKLRSQLDRRTSMMESFLNEGQIKMLDLRQLLQWPNDNIVKDEIQTEDEVEIIDGTILKGDIETSDDPTVFISDDFETLLGQDEEISFTMRDETEVISSEILNGRFEKSVVDGFEENGDFTMGLCASDNIEIVNESTKELRCRTCLISAQAQSITKVTQHCINNITVKEAILMIIPNLEIQITEDDVLCSNCSRILKVAVSFVFTCLKSDHILEKELKDKDPEQEMENTEFEKNIGNKEKEEELGHEKNEIELENRELESFEEADLSRKMTKEEKQQEESENKFLRNTVWDNTKYPLHVENFTEEECQWLNFCSYYNKKHRPKHLMQFANFIAHDHNKLLSVKHFTYESSTEFVRCLPRNVKVYSHNSVDKIKRQRVLLLCSVFRTKCPECDKEFLTESKLIEHFHCDHQDLSELYLIEKPEEDSFKCNICDKRFSSFQQKYFHVKHCVMVLCPFCNQNFSSVYFSFHVKENHRQYYPFNCFKCSKQFRSFDLFRVHRCWIQEKDDHSYSSVSKRHKYTYQKKYKCSKCKRKFYRKEALSAHEISCRRRELCPYCGKLLSRRCMRVHIRNMHGSKTLSRNCNICEKSFKTQKCLNSHIKGIHESKYTVCEICGIKCRPNSIKLHRRAVHFGIKRYTCVICSMGFSKKKYLEQHVAAHQNENQPEENRSMRRGRKKYFIPNPNEPFPCKFCLKICSNLYNLRTHMSKHVKLYRYKCRYCDMTYSNLSSRIRHERYHPPHVRCNTCWKQFSSQEELDLHEKNHSKNYVCEFCGELFSRENQWLSHLAENHIEKEDVQKEFQELFQNCIEDFIAEETLDNTT